MKKRITVIVFVIGILLILSGIFFSKNEQTEEKPTTNNDIVFSEYVKKDGKITPICSLLYYKLKDMNLAISILKDDMNQKFSITYGQEIIASIAFSGETSTKEVYQIQSIRDAKIFNTQDENYLFVRAYLNNCPETEANCQPNSLGFIYKYDKSNQLIWEKKIEEFYVTDVTTLEKGRYLLTTNSNQNELGVMVMDSEGNFSPIPLINSEISTIDFIYNPGSLSYIGCNNYSTVYVYDNHSNYLKKIDYSNQDSIAQAFYNGKIYRLTKEFYLKKYDMEGNLLEETLIDMKYSKQIEKSNIKMEIEKDKVKLYWQKDEKYFYLMYDLNQKIVLERSYLEKEEIKDVQLSAIYVDSSKFVYKKEQEFFQIIFD